MLQEAGGFSGPVNINYNTTSATGQIFAEAIGNMIRQNLGLEVKYTGKQGSEITELADTRKLDGLRFSGWGHDYPSIEDYLTPMFKSTGDANFAGYNNPALDKPCWPRATPSRTRRRRSSSTSRPRTSRSRTCR